MQLSVTKDGSRIRLITSAQLIRTIAKVLEEVEIGASIVIMRHGKPIAALTDLATARLEQDMSNLFLRKEK